MASYCTELFNVFMFLRIARFRSLSGACFLFPSHFCRGHDETVRSMGQ